MNAQEIINYIGSAEKKTPVKLYVKENAPIDWGKAKVFGAGDKIIFGEWKELEQTSAILLSKMTGATVRSRCWT